MFQDILEFRQKTMEIYGGETMIHQDNGYQWCLGGNSYGMKIHDNQIEYGENQGSGVWTHKGSKFHDPGE